MQRLKILARHNAVIAMVVLWLIGVIWLATHFSWAALALAPLGIPAQMLNEYNTHRFIFHMPPPKSQFWFNLLYKAHYGHHDFPNAEKLFFVPVWWAVPVALGHLALFWGGFWLAGFEGAFSYAVAIVLVGGIATFLAYEWFHMTAHLSIEKTWIEQHVSRLHAQHHFRDFSRWFHVSPGGQIIDKAMGTAISREELKQQSRMEFITTLGLAPDDPRLLRARAEVAAKMGVDSDEIARQSRPRKNRRTQQARADVA